MGRLLQTPSLPWWGLAAAWGAFQARRVTKPSVPSGLWQKGVAEQGTGSLCFPALPDLALLSRVPSGVPTATTYQAAATETPVPPPARKPGRRLELSDQSIFARGVADRFTKRKLGLSYRREKYRSSGHTSQRCSTTATQISR